MRLPAGPALSARKALVAGAGIGGLTAAIALRRRGLAVTVLERAPALSETGAGIQLSPNASRILLDLGLGDPLTRDAVRPERIVMRGMKGVLAQVPLGAIAEARYGAPYLLIHRAALQEALFAQARVDGVEIVFGAGLSGFTQATDGVDVEIAASSHAGDLLVGADGIWSRTRCLLLGDGPPRRAGRIAARAMLPPQAVPPALRGMETGLWLGRDAHLVHYPVQGGRLNLVAVIEGDLDDETWNAEGEPALVRARFTDWPAEARALIEAAPSWRLWALADRDPAPRWGEGRVTLLGDAAHPVLPFLAQGGAQAVEDAAFLATSLAEADDIPAALRRYEHARRLRTAPMAAAARRQGRMFHLHGPAAWARDAALRLIPPHRLLARQDWLYGWRAPRENGR